MVSLNRSQQSTIRQKLPNDVMMAFERPYIKVKFMNQSRKEHIFPTFGLTKGRFFWTCLALLGPTIHVIPVKATVAAIVFIFATSSSSQSPVIRVVFLNTKFIAASSSRTTENLIIENISRTTRTWFRNVGIAIYKSILSNARLTFFEICYCKNSSLAFFTNLLLEGKVHDSL